MQNEADEVICGVTPEPFYGVGQFYKDFSQTTDKEARNFLSRSAKGMGR
jgi:putative phosphoribosyl transferase